MSFEERQATQARIEKLLAPLGPADAFRLAQDIHDLCRATAADAVRESAPGAKAECPHGVTVGTLCMHCALTSGEAKAEATTGGMALPDIAPPGSRAKLWSERANGYIEVDASGWRKRMDAAGQIWLYEQGPPPYPYVHAEDVTFPKADPRVPQPPASAMAPKLSAEARAARAPRPPEELVDALQDRIHPTSGRLIDAKPIVTQPASETAKCEDKCPTCGGSGSVDSSNQYFPSSQGHSLPCPTCNGTGTRPSPEKTESKPGETVGPSDMTCGVCGTAYIASVRLKEGAGFVWCIECGSLKTYASGEGSAWRTPAAPYRLAPKAADDETDTQRYTRHAWEHALGIERSRPAPQSHVELTSEELGALEWCIEHAWTSTGYAIERRRVATEALRKLNARAGVEEK